MRLLRRMADSGKGIIAVMHDLPLAFSFSDEIVVIDQGKAGHPKAPSELCDSPQIREIFNVSVGRSKESGGYYYRPRKGDRE